ncbi:hypothetical protein Ahy_A03g010348 [Arachis hypogaea]|uniref:DUF4283 domain-containing protein n=1 Tax=Arachis hypogaea TaxID=3818 RepID=A0A445DLY8_ARAHY|nr:hypothetical protein Ahy_A03g010348 [Arachis hypogaea]
MVTGDIPEMEDDVFSSEDEEMRSNQEAIPETEHTKNKDQENRTDKPDITVVDVGEGHFNIIINEAAKTELRKPWWRSLIVKLLGRKIGYADMKRRFGGVDVIHLGNDFYLAKFYAKLIRLYDWVIRLLGQLVSR